MLVMDLQRDIIRVAQFAAVATQTDDHRFCFLPSLVVVVDVGMALKLRFLNPAVHLFQVFLVTPRKLAAARHGTGAIWSNRAAALLALQSFFCHNAHVLSELDL
jgi:hypothetical protein